MEYGEPCLAPTPAVARGAVEAAEAALAERVGRAVQAGAAGAAAVPGSLEAGLLALAGPGVLRRVILARLVPGSQSCTVENYISVTKFALLYWYKKSCV
jgi:hypothetical protein